MRISDWSSDVCSSDLRPRALPLITLRLHLRRRAERESYDPSLSALRMTLPVAVVGSESTKATSRGYSCAASLVFTKSWISRTSASLPSRPGKSEEHTSELQSLMRTSYAVFCLKKKQHKQLPPRYILCANINTITIQTL